MGTRSSLGRCASPDQTRLIQPDSELARQDEKAVLAPLDRLMTRMRAVEGQLLQIAKREKQH